MPPSHSIMRSPLAALVLASALALAPSLGIMAALFWPVEGWHDSAGYIVGRDFVNFWFAAKLTAEGRISELYDLAAYHAALASELAPGEPFMNFSYMPNALPLIRPLALLPYGVALALWQCAGLVAFAAAVTGRLVPAWHWQSLLILLSPVVVLVFGLAQATFFLALLFVSGFRMLDSRPSVAGVLFGLMTIKPQLGLLIPIVLALDRQWTAILAASATALALAALSVLLYGLEPWQAYVANTLPYQARIVAEPFGFVWTMMISPYAFFCQLGVAPRPAMALHGILALGVAGLALLAVTRTQQASLRASIVALAGVIVTPYSLAYDLAVPAAALLWHLGMRKDSLTLPRAGVMGLFWMLPVGLLPLNVIGIPVMPPLIAAALVVVVLDLVAPLLRRDLARAGLAAR